MSASFKVRSSTGDYEVSVAQGNFAETLSRIDDAHILCDAFFRPRFDGSAAGPMFVAATEEAKSLDRMPGLIEAFRAAGANRQTHLVAVGGGVIQDIAAFLASVYMRGIGWSYDPTTVLGMVDSCIGGKSSINVGPYKNLIGTFHPPNPILIDPLHAETLPRAEFASGLIEAAKICFCRGTDAFEKHLSCGPSTEMSTDALEDVVVNSLLAKKHFIEIDEFDRKERLLLNFGHTFGHAIEGASHFGVPHGVAVGLGILCSLAFQRERGVSFDAVPRVASLEQHLDAMIRTLPDLQEQIRGLDVAEVLRRFASDKKHTRDRFTLVLVAGNGDVMLERMPRGADLELRISAAVQTTIERYAG